MTEIERRAHVAQQRKIIARDAVRELPWIMRIAIADAELAGYGPREQADAARRALDSLSDRFDH